MTKKDVIGIKDISDTPLQCQKSPVTASDLSSFHFIIPFYFPENGNNAFKGCIFHAEIATMLKFVLHLQSLFLVF